MRFLSQLRQWFTSSTRPRTTSARHPPGGCSDAPGVSSSSETTAISSIDRADFHRRIDELPTQHSADVRGGLPVFRGTRVPARALIDYLTTDDSLDAFHDDFPSLRREQAIGLLELTRELMPN